MAPKRKADGQFVYTMPDNTEGTGEEQTPSRHNDPATPAEATETEDVTNPPTTHNAPAADNSVVPSTPAYGPEYTNDGGFIEGSQSKPRVQKIRWHELNQRKLLLFGFGRKVHKAEHERIAKSFKENPTEKSVEVYLTKKRSDLRKLVTRLGICEVDSESGRLNPIPRSATEAEEAAQDASFGKKPMTWTAAADCKLLLFGLSFNLTDEQSGRMAPHIPGRPTRQSIHQRIQEMYEESQRLLVEHGLIPAPTTTAPNAADEPEQNPRPAQRRRILAPVPATATATTIPPFTSMVPPVRRPVPAQPRRRPDIGMYEESFEIPPAIQEQRQLAREVNAARQALIDADEARARAIRRVQAAERAQAEAKARRALEDDDDLEQQ